MRLKKEEQQLAVQERRLAYLKRLREELQEAEKEGDEQFKQNLGEELEKTRKRFMTSVEEQ